MLYRSYTQFPPIWGYSGVISQGCLRLITGEPRGMWRLINAELRGMSMNDFLRVPQITKLGC